MSGRTTLKSYFLTGATPTEANFADLIDSVLVLEEDLTDSLSSTSSTLALTASAGKSLNDSILDLTTRVTSLEGVENNFLDNYYNKTEIDTKVSDLNTVISNSSQAGAVSALTTRVTGLEDFLDTNPYAEPSHTHAEFTSLSGDLATKADISYVDNKVSDLTNAINSLELGSDESAEIASLQSQVDTISTTISGLATKSDLDAKSDTNHTHTVANISDISSVYYNKTETDTLLSNVGPQEHTHVEADITDLDKYTQGAVDLKLLDHNSRTDNPHSVTATQLGLGNVENYSIAEIFQSSEALLLATKAELSAAVGSDNHSSRTDNPHGVTKAQVGLSDVPNVNFQSLLDEHLNASNPHNINLSYFDVYSESETDSRIQFYIDALRYNFKPVNETDGAGAVGDIAYDSTGLYFKFGPTEWRQVVTSKTFNDGSAGSSFEIDTPKLEVNDSSGNTYFSVDSTTTNTSTTVNTTSLFVTGGTNTNLFKVDGATSVAEINTTNLSIGGITNIAGSTTIGTSGVNQNLTVNGGTTVTGSISTAGISSTSGGTFTGGSVNIGTSATNQNLNVNGSATISGDLIINGTTTTIDTANLLIEDNIVVLNKNQTGTPANTLQSGIEVERGDADNTKIYFDEASGEWKVEVAGTVKTIAFVEELYCI